MAVSSRDRRSASDEPASSAENRGIRLTRRTPKIASEELNASRKVSHISTIFTIWFGSRVVAGPHHTIIAGKPPSPLDILVIPRRSEDALADVKHVAARTDQVGQQDRPRAAEPPRLVLVRRRRPAEVQELAQDGPQDEDPGAQEAERSPSYGMQSHVDRIINHNRDSFPDANILLQYLHAVESPNQHRQDDLLLDKG